MESVKQEGKSKQHPKKKKWRQVQRWRKCLGIQGTSHEEEDLHYILSKAMERISILEWNDNKKEEQIRELLLEQDADLQSQILRQQREILALKSRNGPREELIQIQQKQIEQLKWEKKILEGEKRDLRGQIWPEDRLEGIGLSLKHPAPMN